MTQELTFTRRTVVWFELRGEEPEPGPPGALPRVPNDHGKVREFLQWMQQTDTYPVIHASSGGGCWSGGFKAEDATSVESWVRRNGFAKSK